MQNDPPDGPAQAPEAQLHGIIAPEQAFSFRCRDRWTGVFGEMHDDVITSPWTNALDETFSSRLNAEESLVPGSCLGHGRSR